MHFQGEKKKISTYKKEKQLADFKHLKVRLPKDNKDCKTRFLDKANLIFMQKGKINLK